MTYVVLSLCFCVCVWLMCACVFVTDLLCDVVWPVFDVLSGVVWLMFLCCCVFVLVRF